MKGWMIVSNGSSQWNWNEVIDSVGIGVIGWKVYRYKDEAEKVMAEALKALRKQFPNANGKLMLQEVQIVCA